MQFKFENLLEVAAQWHEKGIGAAVATVIETWGSAPRRVGSQLIVSGDGRMEGSVSGGCVEGFPKRVNLPSKLSSTVPIGPCLCLPRINSARPWRRSISSCQTAIFSKS